MARFWTLLALAAVAVGVGTAAAHNSWVVAGRNVLPSPGGVRLAFVTAHDAFPKSEVATDPTRVASWFVQHDGERRGVFGFAIDESASDLAARVELEGAGLHVAAVALHPRFIEFEAGKFNGYLEEERAAAALASRRRSGEFGSPGREFYTKMGKAFVQVGPVDEGDRGFLEPVGHELEIVPLSHPATWRRGDALRVRVLRGGEPVSGVHVSSGHESGTGHDYVETVATDRRGEATFRIDRGGHWFIRTHMIERIQSDRAEWESFWASLTFAISE